MPARRREILDSEDEDDLVAVNPRSPEAAGTLAGDAPLLDVDADQSSASTAEQLRRAQIDLMAPTQDNPLEVTSPVIAFSDLAATSAATSPSSTNKKRPLTDAESAPRTSGKLKRIRVVSQPEPTLPDSVPVFNGTNDTIPGPTIPSLAGGDVTAENRTSKARPRRSSQQHDSSGEQHSSLTPWSVSADGSSQRRSSTDASANLPQEMYQPRPSRSRSAQIDTTSYDFTSLPEKVAKKSRPKRSVTDTTKAADSAPMFPETPILQAPEYERLSPPPNTNTFESSTYGTTIPETSLADPAPSSKSQSTTKKASKAKQPGKRGRPKKQSFAEEKDVPAPEDETPVAAAKTPRSASKVEVQVVIPARQSMDENMAEILHNLGHKSRKATPQPDVQASLEAKTSQSSGIGATTDSRDDKAEEEPTEESKSDVQTKEERSTPVPTARSKSDIESTPKVNKKTAKSSPSKPSWQRTPYRVGLSKTQRIPSLLKVFKR